MVLPDSVENTEVTGVFAATRVSVLEGNGLQHTEAWAAIRANEVLVFPTDSQKPKEKLTLSEVECFGMFYPLSSSNKSFKTSRPEFRGKQQTYKSLLRQESLCSLCCSVIRREHAAAIFCESICVG